MKKPNRYVDFVNNPQDFEVILLGALGRSTKFIISQVGYSPCQITYRLHKMDIRRADFRNGESELSQRLLNVEKKVASNYLRRKI